MPHIIRLFSILNRHGDGYLKLHIGEIRVEFGEVVFVPKRTDLFYRSRQGNGREFDSFSITDRLAHWMTAPYSSRFDSPESTRLGRTAVLWWRTVALKTDDARFAR